MGIISRLQVSHVRETVGLFLNQLQGVPITERGCQLF